jgi:hypothetical protein
VADAASDVRRRANPRGGQLSHWSIDVTGLASAAATRDRNPCQCNGYRMPGYCTAAICQARDRHNGDKINQINAVSGYYTILT